MATLTRAAGAGTDTGLYLYYHRQEGRALRAMKAAGCPPDTKIVGPY